LRKTRDYTVENSRFSFIHSIFDNIVLVLFLFGGLLNIYNSFSSLGPRLFFTPRLCREWSFHSLQSLQYI
jgi:hypothetical protein